MTLEEVEAQGTFSLNAYAHPQAPLVTVCAPYTGKLLPWDRWGY